MTTRPTRIAQTSTEVKKLYKRNGPALSERQQRQFERAAELEERAQEIREREERNKANKKKREERERKEAALRKSNGVGLATQLMGYSHTQAQLKKGMEAFLGYKKKSEKEQKEKELEVAKQLEAVVEEVAKEPWDDDADDAFDVPEPDTRSGDQWVDDDLDDDTLLELHDQIMSDPIEETTQVPHQPKVASSASVTQSPKVAKRSNEMDFVRLHGPINKMIESILDKLPDPLIELLSQDCSVDPATWDPSPTLLHKLIPSGLPPHRLRIKVGCVVTLLRDLNSSSQLSKSQHLQILRAEQERLECLVLDGQLEGTKAFLTRISFAAKHRNDDNFPFQRIQFPIQVSKDFAAPPVSRKPSQLGFKKPTLSGYTPQLANYSSKRTMLAPKAVSHIDRNPTFKLPGLPASRAKPGEVLKSATVPPTSIFDGWDDFLDTATQIARDLSSEPSSPHKALPQPSPGPNPSFVPATSSPNSIPPLSIQDFDFSLEDLDDSPVLPPSKSKTNDERPTKIAAHPLVPVKPTRALPSPKQPTAPNTERPSTDAITSQSSTTQLNLKRKFPETMNKAVVYVAPRPRDLTLSTRRDSSPAPKRPHVQSIDTKHIHKTGNKTVSNVGAKRSANNPQPKTMPSFSEFGLSTQEAVSFFDDDDEFAFGSPPIAV